MLPNLSENSKHPQYGNKNHWWETHQKLLNTVVHFEWFGQSFLRNTDNNLDNVNPPEKKKKETLLIQESKDNKTAKQLKFLDKLSEI